MSPAGSGPAQHTIPRSARRPGSPPRTARQSSWSAVLVPPRTSRWELVERLHRSRSSPAKASPGPRVKRGPGYARAPQAPVSPPGKHAYPVVWANRSIAARPLRPLVSTRQPPQLAPTTASSATPSGSGMGRTCGHLGHVLDRRLPGRSTLGERPGTEPVPNRATTANTLLKGPDRVLAPHGRRTGGQTVRQRPVGGSSQGAFPSSAPVRGGAAVGRHDRR